MTVVIGVDPHKRSHTAVVIDHDEIPLATLQVRAGRTQLEELLAWSASFEDRVWAIESANGLGYLLGQQLVGAGERVLDVPATLVGAGAGVGDVTVEQERPERRVVGRDRSPTRATHHRGPGGGSSGRVAAVGEAPQRSGPAAEPHAPVGCTRCCASSPRVESARKSRRTRRNGCSTRSRRRRRSSAPATSSPAITSRICGTSTRSSAPRDDASRRRSPRRAPR